MTPRTLPVVIGLLAMLLLSACGGEIQATPAASAGVSGPAFTPLVSSAVPTSGTAATSSPSSGPATPAPTASLNPGFQLNDILKVQVNSLAARIAPKRTAALVHAYDISGPAPVDGGAVRLDKGAFVSVELGPVPVGDTVWYLVWPAPGAKLHPGGLEWYTAPPPDHAPVPAWVAASVGADEYLKFERHENTSDLAAFGSPGVMAAGRGSFVSAPQERHDAFQLGWAASTTASGTDCAMKIALVPADGDFDPKVGVQTSTTTVKVGPLGGTGVSAPWLPADTGSWTTFTINVTGTCNWAFHLVRLEHD